MFDNFLNFYNNYFKRLFVLGLSLFSFSTNLESGIFIFHFKFFLNDINKILFPDRKIVYDEKVNDTIISFY